MPDLHTVVKLTRQILPQYEARFKFAQVSRQQHIYAARTEEDNTALLAKETGTVLEKCRCPNGPHQFCMTANPALKKMVNRIVEKELRQSRQAGQATQRGQRTTNLRGGRGGRGRRPARGGAFMAHAEGEDEDIYYSDDEESDEGAALCVTEGEQKNEYDDIYKAWLRTDGANAEDTSFSTFIKSMMCKSDLKSFHLQEATRNDTTQFFECILDSGCSRSSVTAGWLEHIQAPAELVQPSTPSRVRTVSGHVVASGIVQVN